jgi:hypothetical protein
MKDELVLSQLEGLAYKLGIAIRYDKVIRDESSDRRGLCRIRGDYVLFIDSQATTKEKIRVTIEAIRQFDLGDIHVMPLIRDLLEGSKK